VPRIGLQPNLAPYVRRRVDSDPVALFELLGLGAEDERQGAVGDRLALEFRRQRVLDPPLLLAVVLEDRLAVADPLLVPRFRRLFPSAGAGSRFLRGPLPLDLVKALVRGGVLENAVVAEFSGLARPLGEDIVVLEAPKAALETLDFLVAPLPGGQDLVDLVHLLRRQDERGARYRQRDRVRPHAWRRHARRPAPLERRLGRK